MMRERKENTPTHRTDFFFIFHFFTPRRALQNAIARDISTKYNCDADLSEDEEEESLLARVLHTPDWIASCDF